MSQQPEAIRLAAVCDLGHPLEDDVVLIGPELLRLHAVELEAIELRAKLSQEKEVVAALLAEQDRLQCALNKRHAQVERLQAAGQVLDASETYKRGWVACAGWAKRPDLIADIDSPAYANERAARLATPQPEPAWSPAYTRGQARQSAPVAAVSALVPLIARQLGEWHEDDGYAVWWAWNGETRGWAGEPAYIGSPLCDNWPGYHTHWTLHPKQPECIGLTVGDGAQPIKDTP